MQREAKLASEYEKMMATAEISFDGKVLNLFGVQKYFEHEDREVRKGAVRAYSDFYHKNEQRLEEIWEELLSIRNEMGRNLGYEDYIPVGYYEAGTHRLRTERGGIFQRTGPHCDRADL